MNLDVFKPIFLIQIEGHDLSLEIAEQIAQANGLIPVVGGKRHKRG